MTFHKIGVEEHFATSKMIELMKHWESELSFPEVLDLEVQKEKLPIINADFSKHRIPVMDKYDVSIQIISTLWPGAQGFKEPEPAVKTAKYYNDTAAELISAYPERFRAFAALPLQDPAAAVEELERCITELGFVGTMIQGHSNFEYLDEEKFDPVWSKLEELDVPLYLHVGHPSADQIKAYGKYTEMLGPTWNWAAEGTTHVLRMVFGGVFERHPEAKLIVGHLGETIPYLLRRIDEGASLTGAKKRGLIKKKPSEYLKKNLYISTSGEYFPETLRCAIDALGIEKILFACDYPFAGIEPAIECIEAANLSEKEKEMIYHLNAERLFKL